MADIYDVQTALTNLAQTAIYPNGTSQPSVANCNVAIFPGWPIPDSLDADLAALNAQVSIFPEDVTRVTTRFDTTWYTTQQNTQTLFLSANSTAGTVTITGSVSLPQSCMIILNNVGYSYGVLANDTLNSIATKLAALIPGATSALNVITLTDIITLAVSVIVTGTSVREVAREKRMFMVTVWAPTPLIRSQIASAITSLFAATYRIAMPDGFAAQLSYSGSREMDILEKEACYRRDIHMIVEFATTQSATNYTIGDNIVNLSV
jgi:hypothetical protein